MNTGMLNDFWLIYCSSLWCGEAHVNLTHVERKWELQGGGWERFPHCSSHMRAGSLNCNCLSLKFWGQGPSCFHILRCSIELNSVTYNSFWTAHLCSEMFWWTSLEAFVLIWIREVICLLLSLENGFDVMLFGPRAVREAILKCFLPPAWAFAILDIIHVL